MELLKNHKFKNIEEKQLILNKISQFLEITERKVIYQGIKGYIQYIFNISESNDF
jgi:hypothetical protein